MAKKELSSLKKILILVGVVVVLGATLAYMQFGKKSLGPREALDKAFKTAVQSNELTREQQQLLRIQLALVDYMAKNGGAPGSLYDLVPVYFDVIPKNPETGKPFAYKKVGMSFELGDDGDQAVASSATSGKGSKDSSKSAKGKSGQEEVFVNPNEMVQPEYTYSSEDKRDPFRPFDLAPTTNIDENVTPLERYTIGQLRVAAVLTFNENDVKAIIEDAAGKGYTARVGTKIGNAGGVIVEITKEKVTVLETHVDFTGKEKQEVIEMKLAPKSQTESKKKKKK